ncbi:chemotaxis-specific protein-glutamate methyltransferase CheB [Desulfosporosinus sp. Sb-LF]|uniref:chemotaxis-specific protein-glutamate methyltransferase CheB n=1 Tax=Desulfosporosinus sp. Sb-LF TaxID=2560027 RepID=UPI00107F3966|nr:chemotaxis-specific protein-glutamate methyltransferase CheB [Desulfosporosinus sp. Sb-LF]TGE32167.1 chemotaxis-specific protein-glutamate methyltransferase CheB [Desulfosporosinus sp. Sb-LF]
MIKVLIVDDSEVHRNYLTYILSSDSEIQVIGQAANGKEALDFLKSHQLDVITMDIYMPEMDGFEVTRRIMENKPVPIVIISAVWDPREVEKTFKAMEVGAVSLLEKPAGIGSPNYEKNAAELIAMVKQAAVAKVARIRPRRVPESTPVVIPPTKKKRREIEVVVLGASTGGPAAIQQFLTGLPKDFPLPILIVQHISSGFTRGFVDWLNESSPLHVYVATQGERIQGGRVYVAPEEFQMGVNDSGIIKLREDPPQHFVRPAASYLFLSALKAFANGTAGILLTGMGIDGAVELKLIKDAGGITFAQDHDSSIIHGMPGEAIRLGGADYVMPPRDIASVLVDLVTKTFN